MSDLQRRFFNVYFQSDPGGGGGDGGFDNEPISFGEAFGINPDGTPYVAPEPDPEPPAPTPEPTPEPEPAADPTPPSAPGEGADPGAGTPPAGETPDQVVERLYGGKYKTVEELEKAHKELTAAWDGRGPQAKPAEPTPPPEPPKPLFKGDISTVENEEQLFKWAQTDPQAAAFFCMANQERMDQTTFDTVMDAWVAQQPFKAMAQIQAWNNDMIRQEFAERQAVQDEAYMNQVADQGIDQAIAELPLMAEHQHDLGVYIEQNPQLQTMIQASRTPAELKNALHAIFYMMAGPKLASQVLESQVQTRVSAEQAAAAAAAAEAAAGKGATITRNTALPPGDEQEYGDRIREMVLNPGAGRK